MNGSWYLPHTPVPSLPWLTLRADSFSHLPKLSPVGFPGVIVVMNSPVNSGDTGLIPGSGRSPGVGNGSPLQYSCPENSLDRGVWGDTVCGLAKVWTGLSNWVHKLSPASFRERSAELWGERSLLFRYSQAFTARLLFGNHGLKVSLYRTEYAF